MLFSPLPAFVFPSTEPLPADVARPLPQQVPADSSVKKEVKGLAVWDEPFINGSLSYICSHLQYDSAHIDLMQHKMIFKISFFLVLITTFISVTLTAQRLYYCDSVTISNGTIRTGACNYFYNFLKESVDSVITNKINFDKDNEIIYHKIKIVAPIDSSGMLDGLVRGFVDSERIFEVPYKHNIPHGYFVQFKNNDTLGYVNLINGKKEGNQFQYLDQEHSMLVISPYENGLLNGKLVLKDLGITTVMTNYKNGLKNGLHAVFYDTGELEFFRIYENNKVKDGKYYDFTIRGEIRVESTYVNNKEVKTVLYGVDGKVRKIMTND